VSSDSGILSRLLGLLRTSARSTNSRRPTPRGSDGGTVSELSPGRIGAAATVEIDPPRADALHITYTPQIDGDPDAGEIVWTWVPYEEHDGRGKDRPVLVIGRRDADTVYAVKLTSKSHDGERDFLPIGSGPWDGQGRPSWIDVDQVYLVHHNGMRREAAALDGERFAHVAAELHKRYGWVLG